MIRVFAVGRSDVGAYEMPTRFRTEIAFFITPAGDPGVPALQPGEYFVRLDEARQWLDDGVIMIVSPLDAASKTEIELSEEQEAWLEWMIEHEIEHVRLEE